MDTNLMRKGKPIVLFSIMLLVITSMMTATLLGGCANPQVEDSVQENASTEREGLPETDDQAATDTEEGEDLNSAEKADGQEDKDPQPKLTSAELKQIEQLHADIKKATDASGMSCYVSVIDLDGNISTSVNGDRQIASASMIKMLIAYSFLEQVDAGSYALDDLYTLKASDIVGGSGTLCSLGAGAQVSYRDILTRMIDVSDNVGANILMDACGMDAVNATAQELGLTQTQLNRHMMDFDAIAAGLDNYTCADDIAKLMQMVYEGSFVDKESSELVMTALRQQHDFGGIKGGLPSDVAFAHKTGSLDTVRHDGGIVEGDHPFVLVVLCGGEGFWEQGALDAMANVAQVAYAGLNQ